MSDDHRPILEFMLQQVEQFKNLSPEFLMQFKDTETLKESLDNFQEEYMQRRTAEERLKGLSPEERLKGLSPEERDRLRQLLSEDQPSDD